MWWKRKAEKIPHERLAELEREVLRLHLLQVEIQDAVLKWMRRERGAFDRAKALPEPNGNDPQARILARRRHPNPQVTP